MKGTSINMPRPEIEIRTDIAHTARVYDYLLGGKDNYGPDRAAADNIEAAWPHVKGMARRQRSFMHRTTRAVADLGVAQFIDIGTGIPTEPNLHQIAQGINPGARVLYVDNDPIVLAHAAALMNSTTDGDLHYLHADAQDPQSILDHAAEAAIDLDQPVALSIIGILHFLPDDVADRLVRTMTDAMAPGSYLTISQGTAAGGEDADYDGIIASYRAAGIESYTRSPEQIIDSWCDGLDIIDPGVVFLHRWRPDAAIPDTAPDREVALLGMVARKK